MIHYSRKKIIFTFKKKYLNTTVWGKKRYKNHDKFKKKKRVNKTFSIYINIRGAQDNVKIKVAKLERGNRHSLFRISFHFLHFINLRVHLLVLGLYDPLKDKK